ncbi:DUF2946 family protein [Sphingomonas sp. RS6]
MTRLRRLFRASPWLAALLVAAALLVRVAVPAGFMPVADTNGSLRLAYCSGYGPAPSVAATMQGMSHEPGEMQMKSPCAFADLTLALIGGADPVQLAALLLFVLAAGLTLALPRPPRAPARLRPPLRAPPLIG